MSAAVKKADLWSSTLLAIEAHRAALRLGIPIDEVDGLLDGVSLVFPAASTFYTAQFIGSAELRTLDALHLAAAVEIGVELEGLVTYDKRLARAGDALGVAVSSPGLANGWWNRGRTATATSAEPTSSGKKWSGTKASQSGR